MTVDEAHDAVLHANSIIDGCQDIDELDEASDWKTAYANCPEGFTEEQKDLAQKVILGAHLKSIGRA